MVLWCHTVVGFCLLFSLAYCKQYLRMLCWQAGWLTDWLPRVPLLDSLAVKWEWLLKLACRVIRAIVVYCALECTVHLIIAVVLGTCSIE